MLDELLLGGGVELGAISAIGRLLADVAQSMGVLGAKGINQRQMIRQAAASSSIRPVAASTAAVLARSSSRSAEESPAAPRRRMIQGKESPWPTRVARITQNVTKIRSSR